MTKQQGFQQDGKDIYKVMFLNTLGIIERIMQTARDKLKNGYTEEEKRGKMESRTYPEAVL